jgi:hypothetical protein
MVKTTNQMVKTTNIFRCFNPPAGDAVSPAMFSPQNLGTGATTPVTMALLKA